jgi:hypothetical protein
VLLLLLPAQPKPLTATCQAVPARKPNRTVLTAGKVVAVKLLLMVGVAAALSGAVCAAGAATAEALIVVELLLQVLDGFILACQLSILQATSEACAAVLVGQDNSIALCYITSITPGF